MKIMLLSKLNNFITRVLVLQNSQNNKTTKSRGQAYQIGKYANFYVSKNLSPG